MTASASVPIAMSTIKKDGYSYVDGGVSDHIPARFLPNYDITELDVIVHRTEDYVPTTAPKNILNHFMKVIDALQVEITKDDIDMIDSYCALNKVQTRIFYLPYKLTSNSLMFDKDTMLEW
jgi:predicted patatin/cPLA2 family phospholipase